MSFYKLLEEVLGIERFQLIQRSRSKLELRLLADNKKTTFNKASRNLQKFLNSKDVFDVEVFLSDELPQANKVSGKFNHIYKDFS